MNDELTTYRIERCEHDIDKHYNAIVMGGHFVGRLEEHLPNCDGSRLVMVECMEAELVVDGRLQAIADAWQRVDYPGRHIIRKAAGELVAVVEDALGGTDNE